jgi:hypothetical protein
MAILTKVLRLNAVSIKVPMSFFAKLEKNSKIHMERQKASNSQSNPRQKEQCWWVSQYLSSNYTTEVHYIIYL